MKALSWFFAVLGTVAFLAPNHSDSFHYWMYMAIYLYLLGMETK